MYRVYDTFPGTSYDITGSNPQMVHSFFFLVINKTHTSAVRSRILSNLIFASCV